MGQQEEGRKGVRGIEGQGRGLGRRISSVVLRF